MPPAVLCSPRRRWEPSLAPVLVAPEVYAATTTRRDLYTRSRFCALRRKTFRLEARAGTGG